MLMDGKDLAKDIKIKLKNEIDDIKRIYGVTPAVASILV
ncbi:MAG: bifunctional methylenetetrahydrofolate dehydrogenase/methenyltetrahydrofolate cyclohydrolase, partial [Fusobacterium periodonticum]|nr:bifunctional methylenetetrahydrofolate dehydrogenase/methenyltetrahydrofolate cyclohydrolase [Fusobacterium periodonticum]